MAGKPLRWTFVTPDMHRIHHSEEIQEQSMNFGEIFPWWDCVFHTISSYQPRGKTASESESKGFRMT